MKYGISQSMREWVDKKIQKQKDFLSNKFCFFTGVSMLDKVLSANLNPKRYFAEVNNRVSAIVRYARELKLMPVFITITLPGEYHPYKDFGTKRQRPNDEYNGSDVHDCMQALSDTWRGFLDLKIFKKLKKIVPRIYIRVVEPHKSGVPHYHVLMFLPKNQILPVKKRLLEYFPGRCTVKYTFQGDTGGVVAYIMKYLNKTFAHSESGEMSDEAYWYAYYGIRRFYTSRTLPPLKHFRRCNYDEKYQNYYDFSKDIFGNRLAVCFKGDYIFRREWYDDDWWDDVVFQKQDIPKFVTPFNMPPITSREERMKKMYKDPQKGIYIGKDMVLVYPILIFSKMSHQELNAAYSDLKRNYNPFVDFEVDRLRVCEREYNKRFSL